MDKKRSSLGLNLNSKDYKTTGKVSLNKEKLCSSFNSPVSNKSTSLYKSVLKNSVEKSGSNHSRVRFSLGDSIEEAPKESNQNEEYDFHCSFESDEENSPDSSLVCTQPVSQEAILQGVVAYIEARSNTENRFEGISQQMELLGAVVVKKFIPEVTHVIFKDGKKTTRERALKKGIHLVNVLWVESCRQSGKRVPEKLFPVVQDEVHTPLMTGKIKRTKSMQPRAFEDDVRNSTERGNRKRQRRTVAERTPTSVLSPLTTRLLSEDSPAPVRPAVAVPSMSQSHIPDTPMHSKPTSPDDKVTATEETVDNLPSKRLNFEELSTMQKSLSLSSSKTPSEPSSENPVKTPVSPRNIPTDILQTASGPGKKRKRIKSTKESASNEPDEKPKQTKKNKPTNSPQKDIDVFSFDGEETPKVKPSKVKKTRKPRSKSTSCVEKKTVVAALSCLREDEEEEDDLRVDQLSKNEKSKIQSSQHPISKATENILSPSRTSGKVGEARDEERDADDMVSSNALSDSGVSLSEVETQIKRTKVLKKTRMRKPKKKEKKFDEAIGTEEERKHRENVEEKNRLNSAKQTEFQEKKTHQAKRAKGSVLKRNKESSKKETMSSLRKADEDEKLQEVCTTTESDEDEKNENNKNSSERDVKNTKVTREKNAPMKKKRVRKRILDDTDDDDDDNDEKNDDDKVNENGGDNNNIGEDDHIPELDDDDDIPNGDGGDKVTYKPREKQNIGKQKLKEKNVIRKKPSRSLVLTSMHYSEQDIVISVVRKLGGFCIADSVGLNTTHVISGSPRRTLNVLMAIAKGNWLVSPEWVMKSLETGYWVDEEPYELADAFPSAQLSRLERVSTGPEYRQELFADVDPIFVCNNTSPPRDDLIQLITLCGGKVCTSFRKASICVGNIIRKSKAINVSERWVIDSITEHVALSFSCYILNPTKSTSPTF